MSEKKEKIINTLCFAIPVILILVTASNVLFYADDYFYGTFLKDGFHDFFTKNIYHFINYNGRVIVHIIDQLILSFVPFIYAVICVLLLILFFHFASLILDCGKIQYFSLSMCFMLFIPSDILKESLFWRSAMVNYLYPCVLVAALIFTLKKSYEKKHIGIFGLILCFLSGASTEQMGIIAVIITVICFFINPSRFTILIKSFIFTAVGVFTIFLSPATTARLNTESAHASQTIQAVLTRLYDLSEKLFALNGVSFFCLLFIFAAILLYKNKILKILSVIFICFLYTYICFFEKIYVLNIILLLLFILYSVISAGIIFFYKKDRYSSICLSTSILSIIVMLMTNSLTYRTLFPFILFTIAWASNIILKKLRYRYLFISALTLTGIIVFVPIMNGYIENKRLDRENIKQFSQTDINYCIDYNDKYRHTMLQDDPFFLETAYEYYDIQDNQTFIFYSNKYPSININGKTLSYPCLEKNNKIYIPFSLIIEEFGGTKDYVNGNASFKYNSELYIYDLSENAITNNNNTINLYDRCISGLYSCMEINTACDIFNWSYSNENNTMFIYEK